MDAIWTKHYRRIADRTNSTRLGCPRSHSKYGSIAGFIRSLPGAIRISPSPSPTRTQPPSHSHSYQSTPPANPDVRE